MPWATIGSVPALVWTATVTPTPGVGARELLEHEHVGDEVRAGAAELLGHADAHQPELAELRGRPRAGSAARGPTAAACGAISSSANRAREVADLALLVGELGSEAHRAADAGARARPRRPRARASGRPRAAILQPRPSVSKRMISQPSSRATRASSASGLTATGCPTARSIGRSDSESE